MIVSLRVCMKTLTQEMTKEFRSANLPSMQTHSKKYLNCSKSMLENSKFKFEEQVPWAISHWWNFSQRKSGFQRELNYQEGKLCLKHPKPV